MKKLFLFILQTAILTCFAQYEGQFTLNMGYGFSGGRFIGGLFKAQYDINQNKGVVTPFQFSDDKNRYETSLYPIEIEILTKNILFRTGYWIPKSQEKNSYSKVYLLPAYQLEMAFGGYAGRFGLFGGFHYFGTVMNGTIKTTNMSNYSVTNITPTNTLVQITPQDTAARYFYINRMGWNEQGINAHLCIGKRRLKKISYYLNLTSTSANIMDIEKKGRGIGHIFEFSTTIPFNKNKDWGIFYRFGYRVNNTAALSLDDRYFPATQVTQGYFMIGLFLPATILSVCTGEEGSESNRDNPVKRWGEMWYDYYKNR